MSTTLLTRNNGSTKKINLSSISPLIVGLIIVLMLLASYILNASILLIIGFFLSILAILAFRADKSTSLLFLLTPFSGIFVYDEKHIFLFLAIVYIVKTILTTKKNIVVPLLLIATIVGYSIIFSDPTNSIKVSHLIGIVLLIMCCFVAINSSIISKEGCIRYYVIGFLFSSIIGFFVSSIPSMQIVLESDILWTENYIAVSRFSGLSYDCNFYALSNAVVVAYLLFGSKNNSFAKYVLAVYFIITGLMTISKSYLIIIFFVIIAFLVMKIRSFFSFLKTLGFIIALAIIFGFVAKMLGYNAITLTLNRINDFSDLNSFTTGRFDIWGKYTSYMFSETSFKQFLFGAGFNVSVVDKMGKAAHNTFIEMFFMFGFVGFILWIVYFLYCFNLIYKHGSTRIRGSTFVLITFLAGIFFLSAYSYESFWADLCICLFLIPSKKRLTRND